MLWKEKYKLGVPLVDAQHRELFQRVERFLRALRASTPWEDKVQAVNETLAFMKGYVAEHFRDEEAYMERIGFPHYASHKKLHADMVSYVAEVSGEYERSGFQEQLMQQFSGKLLAWLINHVASEDQRLAAYAIEKGVAAQ